MRCFSEVFYSFQHFMHMSSFCDILRPVRNFSTVRFLNQFQGQEKRHPKIMNLCFPDRKKDAKTISKLGREYDEELLKSRELAKELKVCNGVLSVVFFVCFCISQRDCKVSFVVLVCISHSYFPTQSAVLRTSTVELFSEAPQVFTQYHKKYRGSRD